MGKNMSGQLTERERGREGVGERKEEKRKQIYNKHMAKRGI